MIEAAKPFYVGTGMPEPRGAREGGQGGGGAYFVRFVIDFVAIALLSKVYIYSKLLAPVLLSTLLNQIQLVHWKNMDRTASDQPGRKLIYHYKRGAKSLLS